VRGKWVCHPPVGIGFMGRGGRITCQKIKQVRILGLAKSTSIFITLIALGTWDMSFSVVTVIRYGQPKKLGLISGRCKGYFSSHLRADLMKTSQRN
jgi:hypothetical protein